MLMRTVRRFIPRLGDVKAKMQEMATIATAQPGKPTRGLTLTMFCFAGTAKEASNEVRD